MQGQFYFSKSGGVGNSFRSGFEILMLILWGLLGGARSRAPTPIHLPLKVHGRCLTSATIYEVYVVRCESKNKHQKEVF
jgi:hypothetical protein